MDGMISDSIGRLMAAAMAAFRRQKPADIAPKSAAPLFAGQRRNPEANRRRAMKKMYGHRQVRRMEKAARRQFKAQGAKPVTQGV